MGDVCATKQSLSQWKSTRGGHNMVSAERGGQALTLILILYAYIMLYVIYIMVNH